MLIINKTENDLVTETKSETETQEKEVIVCAACLNLITDPEKKIQVNDAFSHVFANPYGHVFEIGCFSQAKGCQAGSVPSDEFTWFKGYEWQIGVCRSCLGHLGWIFSDQSDRFYGLILEKLIFP